MKKTTILAVAFIIGIIAISSIYGVYNFLDLAPSGPSPTSNLSHSASPTQSPQTTETSNPTQSPSSTATPNPNASTPTILKLRDGRNASVTLHLPLERIISLNSGLTELLVAIGLKDKIIGRDETSTTPPSVLSITVVGANAYEPNVEKIIELEPDVIFADSMLCYNDGAYNKLEDADIPIYITDPVSAKPATPDDLKPESPTAVDYTCDLLQKLSVIVEDKKVVNEFIDYVQHYNNIVRNRLATLQRSQKPLVLLEWYRPYYTFQTTNIYQAGGINIAENISLYAPQLNSEFVIEQNPDIIIRLVSSQSHDVQEFILARNQILDREELADVSAVKNGKVFICDYTLRSGIHSLIGYIYWAKWCQPDLFADLDPVAINQELEQKFFGTTLTGTFAYAG